MSSNAWSLNHCLVSVHKDPYSLLFQILFDKAVFRNDLNLQCNELNIIIKDIYLARAVIMKGHYQFITITIGKDLYT